MQNIDTQIEAAIDHLAEATEALKKARRRDRETCLGYISVGQRVMSLAMASVLRLTQQVDTSADGPVVQFSPQNPPSETHEALAVPKRLRGKMKPERAHIFAKLEALEVKEEVFFPLPADMTIDQFVARVCNVQRRVKQDTNQCYETEQNREKTGVHTIRVS